MIGLFFFKCFFLLFIFLTLLCSALMEKDLGLVMDIATKTRVRTPLGTNAHQIYGALSDHG